MITRILLKFKFLSLKFKIWRFKIGRPDLSIFRSRTTSKEGRTNNAGLSVQEKGYTLIEIIVLIVMAGILLPAIVVPFVTGVRGSGKPEMVTTAMYLAEHRMEELMKYDYQTLRANSLTGLTSYASAPILKLISKRIQAYQRGAFQILCHPLPPYFN